MNRRKEIADRVVARWKAHGFALDADPQYMLLVELWIDGAIEAREMRSRYLTVLREQGSARASRYAWATGTYSQLTEGNRALHQPEPDQAIETAPTAFLPTSTRD